MNAAAAAAAAVVVVVVAAVVVGLASHSSVASTLHGTLR
jgi:hypothetical protein